MRAGAGPLLNTSPTQRHRLYMSLGPSRRHLEEILETKELTRILEQDSSYHGCRQKYQTL